MSIIKAEAAVSAEADLKKRILSGLIIGVFVTAVIFWGSFPLAVALLVINVLAYREFFRLTGRVNPLTCLNAFFFITLPLALAMVLRSHGAWLLFMIVAATAVCDTFAYLVGKRLGKHRLAPKLSPGKTVEGTIGGIAASSLFFAAAGGAVHFPSAYRLAAGFFIGVAAVAGDLLESAFKRKAGVKDSGEWIPGHGGILDRIDSHLAVLGVSGFVFLVCG